MIRSKFEIRSREIGLVVLVAVVAGLMAAPASAAFLTETFDGVAGEDLNTIGWTQVGVGGANAPAQISDGWSHPVGGTSAFNEGSTGTSYSKALPGGAYTLGAGEQFIMESVHHLGGSLYTIAGVPGATGEWGGVHYSSAWARPADVSVTNVPGVPDIAVGYGQALQNVAGNTYHFRMIFDANMTQTWYSEDGVTYQEGTTVAAGADTVDHVRITFWNNHTGAGMGHIDSIRLSLEGAGVPPATTFTWNKDGVGDWAEQSNWSFTGSSPLGGVRANNPNHTAIFGELISNPTTVATNAAVTVNRIELDNTTNGYVVSGHGSVNMAATTAAMAVDPTMSVLGTHQFQAIVKLDNATTVDVASGSALSFNNILNLNGNSLTKTGAGAIAVNNQLTMAGGTLSVQQGTVSGVGTVGGDLNNDGGKISPGNIANVASAVPEPTSFLLMAMAVVAGLWLGRWRN